VTLWYGLFAPAGVSDSAIAVLNSAVIEAMAVADIREKFSAQGVDATSDTSAEFMKLIRAESSKWRTLLQSEGIKPE
jgi:tripartite-type tricarboxylate transporter receptor subunit TctC